ncbi:MAG: hypothetical protein U9N87_12395, partial [Planctomycetota bacterium]|nr:hypothetical protein [Planctomycetota bacterium]
MFARFLFARFLVVFLTTLLVVRVPGTAYGLDYYWDANGNIPPDGVFNVPFNWNPNMVPDPWDVAIFNLSDIYIVTFDNSPIVDYFQVLNNGEVWFTGQSGTETFTMDGLTGEVLIDQGGVLVVSDL